MLILSRFSRTSKISGQDDLGEGRMAEANSKIVRLTRLWKKIDPEMKTFPVSRLGDLDVVWKDYIIPLNNLVKEFNDIQGRERQQEFRREHKDDYEFIYQVCSSLVF